MKLNLLKLFSSSLRVLCSPQRRHSLPHNGLTVSAGIMPIALFQRSITENEKPTLRTA